MAISHTFYGSNGSAPAAASTEQPGVQSLSPRRLVEHALAALVVLGIAGNLVSCARTDKQNDDPCVRHIEVHDAEFWAKELGEPSHAVQANHRINLWERAGENRGRKVGELLVGSRAEIVAEEGEYYRVKSPFDGSTGWLNKMQVARTIYQHRSSRQACTPPE
jgi:hypothetical protein